VLEFLSLPVVSPVKHICYHQKINGAKRQGRQVQKQSGEGKSRRGLYGGRGFYILIRICIRNLTEGLQFSGEGIFTRE